MLKIKFTHPDLKKRLRLLRDLASRRRRNQAAPAPEKIDGAGRGAPGEDEAALKTPCGS
jgi:hypothetical protein